MDKIVYLYGSARDASTRALRRTSYPRGEMQVRVGPWLVRPARRIAVHTSRLLPFAEDLLKKISAGVVQVQRADSSVVPLEEVRGWTAPSAPAPVTAAPESTPAPEPVAVATPAPVVEEPVVAEIAAPAEEPAAEPVVEAPAEEPATLPDPPAEIQAPRESLLPEDWRQFTAKDLQALCTEHNIPLAKTTKSGAVAAIESWIGGN